MGQDPPKTTRDRTDAARRGETWRDHWQRRFEKSQPDDDAESGDRTKPPQPEGTTPLERDQRPINQSR
jgi:hypothetical protein